MVNHPDDAAEEEHCHKLVEEVERFDHIRLDYSLRCRRSNR
jgi:hypothetical protein